MKTGGSFPLGEKKIRLAMLGMVDGNRHPYSWVQFLTVITKKWKKCHIRHSCLLGRNQKIVRIPNAELPIFGLMTLLMQCMCQSFKNSNVMEKAADAIGKVDAVIVATDKGFEHVEDAVLYKPECLYL